VRRFCTYFDGRYAPRALLMLRSLCDVLEDAEVWALGLDERALALAPYAPRAVRFTALIELLSANAELAAAHAAQGPERGWLMTIKPAWLAFVLERTPVGEGVTYVDADMMFLESPAAALDEGAEASIVLSPQRFTIGPAPEVFWGRYNAGWLGLRHDATALAFLEAWQRDCVGRMSPRYSNQKFLDHASTLHPNVCVLRHPGVNLAHWNVGGVTLAEREGRVLVDGRPLIAYHMAGLFPLVFGRCATGVTGRVLRGVLADRVYAPYLRRLRSIAEELGVAPVNTLDRVNWPERFQDRWLHRVALGLGWVRGDAVRF
jgi:hypothetical protein